MLFTATFWFTCLFYSTQVLGQPLTKKLNISEYYSYLSKCNIFFNQRKNNQVFILFEQKKWIFTSRKSKTDPGHLDLFIKNKKICSYFIDEGKLFIINQQYQFNCEDAKIITLHPLHDPEVNNDLPVYLADHNYIFSDTPAITAKAAFLNSLKDYKHAITLLNQLLIQYPDNEVAYLYLSDAFQGISPGSKEAVKAYEAYIMRYSQNHGSTQHAAYRPLKTL